MKKSNNDRKKKSEENKEKSPKKKKIKDSKLKKRKSKGKSDENLNEKTGLANTNNLESVKTNKDTKTSINRIKALLNIESDSEEEINKKKMN